MGNKLKNTLIGAFVLGFGIHAQAADTATVAAVKAQPAPQPSPVAKVVSPPPPATPTPSGPAQLAAAPVNVSPVKTAASSDRAGEEMASMQAEIAMLDIKIKLAEKRNALAKLVAKDESSRPDLNSPAPAGPNASGGTVNVKRKVVASPALVQLPTYDSVDGIDGKLSVNVILADGSLRTYGVGEGEQDWKIVSIALNKVIVQQGKNKFPLQKDDGAPKNFPNMVPTLGSILPPPVPQ